jgi:hypothetical protein
VSARATTRRTRISRAFECASRGHEDRHHADIGRAGTTMTGQGAWLINWVATEPVNMTEAAVASGRTSADDGQTIMPNPDVEQRKHRN